MNIYANQVKCNGNKYINKITHTIKRINYEVDFLTLTDKCHYQILIRTKGISSVLAAITNAKYQKHYYPHSKSNGKTPHRCSLPGLHTPCNSNSYKT